MFRVTPNELNSELAKSIYFCIKYVKINHDADNVELMEVCDRFMGLLSCDGDKDNDDFIVELDAVVCDLLGTTTDPKIHWLLENIANMTDSHRVEE